MNLSIVKRGMLAAAMVMCTHAGAAEPAKLGSRLSGAAEVPANMSTGSGTLDATLDRDTSILTWRVTYSGLTGPVTAAHFHGPAMPGENAGVVVPFASSTTSPIEGQATLSAAQLTELLAGKWYVNLHTAAHPGGELRGQVTITPANPERPEGTDLKRNPRAVAMALTLAAAMGAQAQALPKIEPGLWELNIALKSQTGGVEAALKQAQEQIRLLPPDQRRQIEQMMAERGVRLGDQSSTLQACISKEDAERGELPQQAGDCTQQVLDRSSTQMKVKFSCRTNPPAAGEAVVDFQNPKAYTSKGVVDTTVAGRAERVNVDQTGRWLGADCGNVKALGK